ncbi:cell division control protein 6-related protein [Babesia gibsoni]|uniref:Origin recognition complex subunit 1 n=1 Tax=Babesia gibsoni TaxID=33632 RepID=A0AAD8LK78_BABGI|nr:cell division control protein 6-related protein [Babesia gibsoni]
MAKKVNGEKKAKRAKKTKATSPAKSKRASEDDRHSESSELLEVEMESPVEVDMSTSREECNTTMSDEEDEEYEEMRRRDEEPSRPYGDVVVEIEGNKFYRAVEIGKEIIEVGDNVDIVSCFINAETRLASLAKIAAIFQNKQGELRAEVAFYHDSNDDVPGLQPSAPGSEEESQWKGFTHHSEVVASNKFEIVDVDSFDERVTVHGSLEEYMKHTAESADDLTNAFCQAVWYSESYAVMPFDVKEGWLKIMLEYSKYHRAYQVKAAETRMPTPRDTPAEDGIIIGREQEASRIKTFIETGIRQGGTGQLLYVCGVPGTGKTETVKMIVRALSEKKMKGKLPWFDLIEINGVHLIDPNEFYRTLYHKLIKQPPQSALVCYQHLDDYFSNNNTPCVLIIDEVDYIVTKKQKVLFTIFDWPSRPSSKLVVVIISNTIDLPNRLKSSCASRLAFGTLVFEPYRYQQILDVIEAKMGRNGQIDEMALRLCARRVTNLNGDMRKALQICKLALNQAKGEKVTTAIMNRVTNMVLSSAVVEALQHSSTATSCLLVALVLDLKETQLSVACARRIYNAFKGMMAVVKPELENTITLESFKKLLVSVAQTGIISLEPTVFTETGPTRKITILREMSEDLGDTGIVPEVDAGQIVTALSRDPYWEKKLRDL